MKANIQAIKKRLRPLMGLYYRVRIGRIRQQNRQKSTRDVFTEIYQRNQWGGSTGEYYSGHGSLDDVTQSYIETVRAFIKEKGIISVVDLGCGDFRVGQQLQMPGVRYTGVDIVEELIERNNAQFRDDRTTFLCRDMITDPLPPADLCLIRQVLQHLSNAQIQTILEKTNQYRWVLVTEHHPPDHIAGTPNIDKPHGSDTRTYDKSGVYLDQSPFDVANLSLLLEVNVPEGLIYPDEKLRTYLIENN